MTDNLPVAASAVVPISVAAWSDAMVSAGAVHGSYEDYRGVMRAADVTLRAVPAEHHQAVVGGFEALPAIAQGAILAELAVNAPGDAMALSDEEIAAWARENASVAKLAREWGKSASHKLAFANARIYRLADRLIALGGGSAEVKAINAWAMGLPEPVWTAILRRLADFEGAR